MICRAWLTGVARHKALDRLRRNRGAQAEEGDGQGNDRARRWGGWLARPVSADEDLCLIYLCCHPALSPEARIALTLRAVGGLDAAEIAAAFLVARKLAMAKRLTRAKNKIRDSGLALAMPRPTCSQTRTADVLRVVSPHLQRGPPGLLGRLTCSGPTCASLASTWPAAWRPGCPGTPRCSACSPCCS